MSIWLFLNLVQINKDHVVIYLNEQECILCLLQLFKQILLYTMMPLSWSLQFALAVLLVWFCCFFWPKISQCNWTNVVTNCHLIQTWIFQGKKGMFIKANHDKGTKFQLRWQKDSSRLTFVVQTSLNFVVQQIIMFCVVSFKILKPWFSLLCFRVSFDFVENVE